MHVNIPLPLACETTFLIDMDLLSNCPACCDQLVKILIALKPYIYIFGSNRAYLSILILYSYWYAKGLSSIILAGRGHLVKILITLELHGIF